jgi:pSer/pThr/pTyr-binding forkhead associated (FHA) protein
MDFEVSRSHARISFQKGCWIVEDLGSANGVIFNGECVARKTLKSGDTFQIGTAALRFMEEDAPEGSEQLSETIKIFAGLIKYQSPLLERGLTRPGFMRLRITGKKGA